MSWQSSYGGLPSSLWSSLICVAQKRERLGNREWWQHMKVSMTFQHSWKLHDWLLQALPLRQLFSSPFLPMAEAVLSLNERHSFLLELLGALQLSQTGIYFKRLNQRGQLNCKLISDAWKRMTGSGNSVSTVMAEIIHLEFNVNVLLHALCSFVGSGCMLQLYTLL